MRCSCCSRRWRCCASCAPSASATRGRMAAFALSGSLALLTHYFAVFLLVPMVVWLASEPRSPAPGGAGDRGDRASSAWRWLPLISAQGGHGTQWIGRWALSSRLQAIPAVLPHRLLRRAARARGRAARGAADPRRRRVRALARAHPARGARCADRAGDRRGRDPAPDPARSLWERTTSRRATWSRRWSP